MLYPPDLPTNFIVDLAGIDNCYEDSRKITNALAIYSADRFPLRLYLEGRAAGKHEIDAVERESLACDKVVYSVFLVDLDVDSDNDDGFGMPDQSVEEDRIEDDSDKPGKLIGVNDADQDGDGVPNFADGFDLWGNEGANAGGQFAPLVLTLEGPMDEGAAEVTFNYSCSDPAYVTRSELPDGRHVYNAAPGHLRIWKVNGSAARRKADVSQTGGHFVRAGCRYKMSDLGSGSPITLYVEGIAPSEGMADQRISVALDPDGPGPLESLSDAADGVRLTVIRGGMTADYNHDRVIDSSEEFQVFAGNPYRFWINDDADNGDVASGDSDVPGHSGGLLGSANYRNNKVDGRCDLIDFFPLWLDLKQILDILPPGDSVQYKLRHEDSGLKAVYTGLSKTEAGAYLITDGDIYGSTFSQPSHAAETFEISPSGVTLSPEFLDKITADRDAGVLLFEGTKQTTSPLILEVWNSGHLVYQREFPLSIDGVEEMYRWVNVRHNTGGSEIRVTDTNEPRNYPDSCCNGKQLAFVHGYNCDETGARGWHAEMFKRLYWAGSRAMFTAVNWQGDFAPGFLPALAYYHANVIKAFEAAPAAAMAIAALPGEKYVAAHSLGNMVVSSAMVDYRLDATRYFMMNAAVPMEAYKATEIHTNDMVSLFWRGYPSRLWSSEWHDLFEDPDARRQLSWRKRFGNIANAVNYFSRGEDVLNNNESGEDMMLPRTEQAWVFQEKAKGGWVPAILLGTDSHGGWGFNPMYEVEVGVDEYGEPVYEPMPATEASLLSSTQLASNSFFRHFYRPDLYGCGGSDAARDAGTRTKLLAEALPATSRATGRNGVSQAFSQSIDLMDLATTWPSSPMRWRHCDLKDVAFMYTGGLFLDLVEGDLR